MPFLSSSNPYNAGYAVPASVNRETSESGAIVTPYVPRRTVMGGGVLGGNIFGGGLGSLGNAASPKRVATMKGDPIAAFGVSGSRLVLAQMAQVPDSHRKIAMKAVLDTIDPVLWDGVSKKASQFQKAKGYNAKTALERAMASTFAERFAKQLVTYGKSGAGRKRPTFPTHGLLGLGCVEGQSRALSDFEATAYSDMAGLWGSITGVVGKIGSGVKTAVNATGSGIKKAAKKTGSAIKTAANAVGSAAKTAANKAIAAGKAAIKGLGSLACKAANSGLLDKAAAAAGAVIGGPVGGMAASKGAGAAQGLCAAKGSAAMVDMPAEESPEAPGAPTSTGVKVAAAGGAAALLALFLL